MIRRDLEHRLMATTNPVQIVLGPRQCGKSTLLSFVGKKKFHEISFDDISMRNLANQDPQLFLEQFKPPLLLDEIQYVPPLFSEIKRLVDVLKKERHLGPTQQTALPILFRMTGSNQILMEHNVKESLAGRASYFDLNTLSVHEILHAFPNTEISRILFQGGWPELYVEKTLSPIQYLNDYIRSYVEKDIIASAGIQKWQSFHLVLSMLAARTGTVMDYTNIANDCSVKSITVKEWVGLLQKSGLVHCLKPYASNLNKRLTKSNKFYFLDTGLACRLQSWSEMQPLLQSPQAGPLFETLVFAEIFKFINNYGKDWNIFFWRTRDGEEVDFLIETAENRFIALDAKLAINSVKAQKIPNSLGTALPGLKDLILVTYGGETMRLTPSCRTMPIAKLHDFLRSL